MPDRWKERVFDVAYYLSAFWLLAATAWLYVDRRQTLLDQDVVYHGACVRGFTNPGGVVAVEAFPTCDASLEDRQRDEPSALQTLFVSAGIASLGLSLAAGSGAILYQFASRLRKALMRNGSTDPR